MNSGTAVTHFVVSYPRLAAPDRRWIDEIRRGKDPQVDAIAPHVTLVFGFTGIDEEPLMRHLRAQAETQDGIDVTFSKIECHQGFREEAHYAFLLPDRGRAELTDLHGRLHGGVLAGRKTGAPPYVPHVTLARATERAAIEDLIASSPVPRRGIAATLSSLVLVARTAGVTRDLATFPFSGGQNGRQR